MQIKNVPDLIGKGYEEFWAFRGRYRVVKGGRASKKSKTTALNLIVRMMSHPDANLLVIRKVYASLRDSCFADLKWAVHKLGADAFWEFKSSPMEARLVETGQKILFRGLDDPMKIASITVSKGHLCWCWIEEAFELAEESDFRMVDESIRGTLPRGLWKQITLTFNPWSDRHWLKKRFFDGCPNEDTLAITTTYQCNEWLDDHDRALFDVMRKKNPKRYRVAGLGEWGVESGLVYDRWREERFDVSAQAFRQQHKNGVFCYGLDFGYRDDPCALFCGFYDSDTAQLYVFDELYLHHLSNRQLFEQIRDAGYAKEKICADSAEPKSIDELRDLGLRRVFAARKGTDSVRHGIRWIGGAEIVVHPRCAHFLAEIAQYVWEKDGTKPQDKNNHLMDAMRYATETIRRGSLFSW